MRKRGTKRISEELLLFPFEHQNVLEAAKRAGDRNLLYEMYNTDLIAANTHYYFTLMYIPTLSLSKDIDYKKAETPDSRLDERKEPLKEVIQLFEENREKKIGPISMRKITSVYNDRLRAFGYK